MENKKYKTNYDGLYVQALCHGRIQALYCSFFNHMLKQKHLSINQTVQFHVTYLQSRGIGVLLDV